MILDFIIHPCDPTVVICYLIQPCDIAVCITYLISHSNSLTYNLRIFQFGCIINTKLPKTTRFSQLVLWKHSSYGLVLPGHQLWKPCDVRRIIFCIFCIFCILIIHPCDPTVVIYCLIRPCDIAVHITHLVSHSSSLRCHTVTEWYFGLGV